MGPSKVKGMRGLKVGKIEDYNFCFLSSLRFKSFMHCKSHNSGFVLLRFLIAYLECGTRFSLQIMWCAGFSQDFTEGV